MKRWLLFNLLLLISVSTLFAQSSKKEGKSNLIISSVRSYLGTPYQYGGTSRKGIDCSGLLYITYNTGGVELPRMSKDQAQFGKNVKMGKLQVGDLVFFEFDQNGKIIHHSGVIVSVEKDKIKFIHASSSRGVVESDLMSKYYINNVVGYRRVI